MSRQLIIGWILAFIGSVIIVPLSKVFIAFSGQIIIGLANYPVDTNNVEELISFADKQMYVEKEGR